MITLEGIKALLVIAGISRLKIDFDDEQNVVKVEYVFKGESANKQITYQEIIESLTIGLSEESTCPIVDSNKQLR